uniref:Amino acid transporter transmembrane domain-containing protein n=1 Tax=Timspurckia oligopyrenoides TaxID=708627 RepID=A0A7S0ZGN1_9RHOD|mmetsp:Transcript_4467/g.7831  ORF Transcript_4467/g.7831 Transcript_4467/m.7831 type:complete len:463 (+) Transcript_4467:69-1457(+)
MVSNHGHGDHNEHLEDKSSDTQAFVNIVKTYIGAGTLGLPYAFRLGGLIGSFLFLSFLCVVSTFCIHIMIRCKRRHPAFEETHDEKAERRPLCRSSHDLMADGVLNALHDHANFVCREPHSFADIGFMAFGTWGYALVEFVVVTCQLGFVCAYLIIIGDTLHSLFPVFSPAVFIIAAAVPLTFLTWLRSMKYFAPLSALVLVVFSVGAVIILQQGYIFYHSALLSTSEIFPAVYLFRLKTLPLFFGTAVYSFEGINLAIPIEDNMLHPEHFPKVMNRAMVAVMAIFSVFGGCAYFFFRHQTDPVIVLCLGLTHSAPQLRMLVELSFCIVLFFTFPIGMFPIVQIVERRILPQFGYLIDDETGEYPDSLSLDILRCVVRSLCVLVVVAVTLSIPDFGVIMELFGAFSNSLATFILPALFSLRIFRLSITGIQRILLLAIVGFGTLAVIISTSFAIQDLIDAFF